MVARRFARQLAVGNARKPGLESRRHRRQHRLKIFQGQQTVSNLTIRGASDTENVLLLNYAGTDVPLTVLNGLTLQDDGRILISTQAWSCRAPPACHERNSYHDPGRRIR